jgi:hypothetical protein
MRVETKLKITSGLASELLYLRLVALELLSDAQSAAFQDNLRRSTLETAIACETVVKQTFFAKATPSGAAYEYLEDKGKVHVTIYS